MVVIAYNSCFDCNFRFLSYRVDNHEKRLILPLTGFGSCSKCASNLHQALNPLKQLADYNSLMICFPCQITFRSKTN